MKENTMRRFAIALVVIGLAPAVQAQRGGPAGFVRVGIEADVVKGAPYAADVVNESIQVLSDGNRIVHRSTSRVYRDSEGRTRREEDRVLGGSPGIQISDPVSGNSWNLDLDSKTARQSASLPFVVNARVNGAAELEKIRIVLDGQLSSFVARGGNGIWLS